jgi:hypothetical protein
LNTTTQVKKSEGKFFCCYIFLGSMLSSVTAFSTLTFDFLTSVYCTLVWDGKAQVFSFNVNLYLFIIWLIGVMKPANSRELANTFSPFSVI